MRKPVYAAALAVLSLASGLLAPLPAGAVQPAQDRVVSAVSASFTPNVQDGVVHEIVQVGSRLILGGTFTKVSPRGSTAILVRNRLLAFDATTGAIDPGFAPNLDGEVDALLPGPGGNSVYVGGAFSTVNGVASKSLALLDVTTGAAVAGFRVPALNGQVLDLKAAGGRLYLGGTFTKVAGVTHGGLATINPLTGALDPFMNLQVAGHHNYNGTGAFGAVGALKLDITPDAARLVVIGNFKTVNGLARDQIAMVGLTGATAVVDPNWNTSRFSAPCLRTHFDSTVRDVDFSPDGSYFVVASSGGPQIGSLCDTAARWETTATGTDVAPTWVDATGGDTLLSVAVTGAAVYVGGHQRWQNNPYGSDHAVSGAVPRPGLAALDPVSGVPLSWNPGRNPRGAGAYAVYATPAGLWVGSDTNYVGNFTYFRGKIAFFPLAGGVAVPPSTTGALPGTVYLVGPAGVDSVTYRSYDGTTVGSTKTLPTTGVGWGHARGAFVVNGTVYLGWDDGRLYRRTFNGLTFGSATLLDPYHDPAWNNVQTGSGQTYAGAYPTFYTELPNVTGMFFAAGRIYYTLVGQTGMFYRPFVPDSGIVGPTAYLAGGGMNWSDAGGMFISGSKLYYASRSTGNLNRVDFIGGAPTGTPTVVSGPGVGGNDWRARALFLVGS